MYVPQPFGVCREPLNKCSSAEANETYCTKVPRHFSVTPTARRQHNLKIADTPETLHDNIDRYAGLILAGSRSDRGSVNAKPEKGKNTKEIDTYLQTEARRTKYGAPAPGPGSRTRSESVDDRNGPRGRRGERSPDSPENDGGRPARRQSTSPDRSRRYSNGGSPQDGDRNPQDDRCEC
jgi:hypothetical protein